MAERNKRLLFLVLTVPGVVLPFVGFYQQSISAFEFLALDFQYWGSTSALSHFFGLWIYVVFAPVVLVLLDLWELAGRRITRALNVIMSLLGSVMGMSFFGVLAMMVWEAASMTLHGETGGWFGPPIDKWGWRDIGFVAAGAAPLIAIVALVLRRSRFGLTTANLAAIGLMGVFVAVVGSFAWPFDDMGTGALLGIYTCLVFLGRIIDTLRQPASGQPG
jgi:hypothetical protein